MDFLKNIQFIAHKNHLQYMFQDPMTWCNNNIGSYFFNHNQIWRYVTIYKLLKCIQLYSHLTILLELIKNKDPSTTNLERCKSKILIW